MFENKTINFNINFIDESGHIDQLETFELKVKEVMAVFTIIRDMQQTYLCELLADRTHQEGLFTISVTFTCRLVAIHIKALVVDNELLRDIILLADNELIEMSSDINVGLHLFNNDTSFDICQN